MSEATFTPGPWSLSGPPYDSMPWNHVYGDDHKHIMHRDRSDDERMANARLMAAAPELYAALSALEPHLDAIVCFASSMDEHEPNRLVVEARAALKKASGQ